MKCGVIVIVYFRSNKSWTWRVRTMRNRIGPVFLELYALDRRTETAKELGNNLIPAQSQIESLSIMLFMGLCY